VQVALTRVQVAVTGGTAQLAIQELTPTVQMAAEALVDILELAAMAVIMAVLARLAALDQVAVGVVVELTLVAVLLLAPAGALVFSDKVPAARILGVTVVGMGPSVAAERLMVAVRARRVLRAGIAMAQSA